MQLKHFSFLEDAEILLVDDDAQVLHMYTHLLRMTGAVVYSEQRGERVVDRVREIVPDLVLLDVHLGMTSGFDVCLAIHEQTDLRDIPIILMSGTNLSTEDIVKGFQQGAVDYVFKPFEAEELCMRMSSHIELARYRVLFKESAMMMDVEIQHQRQQLFQRGAQVEAVKAMIHRVQNKVEQILSVSSDRERVMQLRVLRQLLDEEIQEWDTRQMIEKKNQSVHSKYQLVLLQQYPNLTQTEVRVCMLIRLEHTSKAIADILNVEVPTVEIYRHRIRRKMGLTKEANLFSHLATMMV
jgi:DNA-binding response OmpR family regulator